MKKNVLLLLTGILIGGLLFVSVSYSSDFEKQITVEFLPIKYFINGIEKSPGSDQAGFIYNDCTYVPLRFIAEALGQPVQWDEATKQIIIGTPPLKEQKLTDIEPISAIGSKFSKTNDLSIGEKKFHYGFTIASACLGRTDGTADFVLGGKYSKFVGAFGVLDSYKNNLGQTSMIVKADGQVIYNSSIMQGGMLPKPFLIDVKGVNMLTVEIFSPFIMSKNSITCAAIGEPRLIP